MYESILVVDALYDKIENLIQDAERHRRTPRPRAISGKTIYVWELGLIQIDSMWDTGRSLATLALKSMKKVSQHH